MRRIAALAAIILVVAAAWLASKSAAQPALAVSIYDTDSSHPWNRLYTALLVRRDAGGASFGANALDLPLVSGSRHLLEQKSHRTAIRALDEFLQSHAEKLIHDPVKRAFFIRDMWTVFDWAVQRTPLASDDAFESEKKELQVRLAEVLRRLAMTSGEIALLPDNYAQAVASGEFPKDYDPSHPDRAFLPPDLFDQHGPWVWIQGGERLAAPQHVSVFSGRSRFLIFLRLPGGRKATYYYLRDLWRYPEPWVSGFGEASDQAEINPLLPTFPPGTEVALVRQMTAFDDHGNLVPAPITESVQIRVYHNLAPDHRDTPGDLPTVIEASGQQFFEIRLDRALLFSGRAGGLREVGRDEKDLFVFNAMPFDELDNPKTKIDLSRMTPIMQGCVWCHRQPGIKSLNSLPALLKPNSLQREPNYELPARWWEQDETTFWKKNREEWGLLKGYWRQENPR